jgi:Helix-turn-helix domain
MPIPSQDLIQPPERKKIEIGLEPAVNAFGSLHLLIELDWLSGLNEWVIQTAASMTEAQRHHNRLALVGFFYAVVPERSWPSFPAYVDYLASQEGETLRDRLMRRYAGLPVMPDLKVQGDPSDWRWALASPDDYLAFLSTHFKPESIEEDIEREAFSLLQRPDEMKQMLLDHFHEMWSSYLEPEWLRVEPMLRTSAQAFQAADLEAMSPEQALRHMTQHAPERTLWWMERAKRVVFVPSAHTGPYTSHLVAEDTLWILFGARMPAGMEGESPELSRAELQYRLAALAEDTRLRILGAIRDQGELSSQAIIDLLGVSQSTASRHLRQLSVTGFLSERRSETGKLYRLDPDRIEATIQALRGFLS